MRKECDDPYWSLLIAIVLQAHRDIARMERLARRRSLKTEEIRILREAREFILWCERRALNYETDD